MRPGGLQGAQQRRVCVGAAGELLAVAGEHEQAVVDPQAEAHAGDEVDGEHRQPRELVDQAQQQEREHDRKAPHEQRQRGRDEPAEHPEGQQQQDREGEHLRPLQVGGGGLVDLVEGDVVAAEAHAAAGHLRAHMPPPRG